MEAAEAERIVARREMSLGIIVVVYRRGLDGGVEREEEFF
jgi:hypothetical protein